MEGNQFCFFYKCISDQVFLFITTLHLFAKCAISATRCGMIWVSDKNLFPFWRAEGSGIQSIHPYPYYVRVFDCLMDERRTFMMQCLPCLKKEICPTYTILYFDIFFIRWIFTQREKKKLYFLWYLRELAIFSKKQWGDNIDSYDS